MSKSVGRSVTRVDAYDKAAGRAKFTDDLCDQGALVTRLVHAAIAHGRVLSIDELQPDGKKRMKSTDFLRGHPIPVG